MVGGIAGKMTISNGIRLILSVPILIEFESPYNVPNNHPQYIQASLFMIIAWCCLVVLEVRKGRPAWPKFEFSTYFLVLCTTQAHHCLRSLKMPKVIKVLAAFDKFKDCMGAEAVGKYLV